MEDIDKKKNMTPTWIQNPAGIKSVWPRYVAEEKVKSNYGWEFTTPEDVPEQRQYPLGSGELTEAGLRRRMAINESRKVANDVPEDVKEMELETLDLPELRIKAKRAGIQRYWVMSKDRLLRELKAQKDNA